MGRDPVRESHPLGTMERKSPVEVVMAKIRRNGPCPRGSGSKAKRCCLGDSGGPMFLCPPVVVSLFAPDPAELPAILLRQEDRLALLPGRIVDRRDPPSNEF